MDTIAFLGVIILAATQLIKMAAPQVQGWLTIIVAVLLGIVVALVDVLIGLPDITVAQGIYSALFAIGVASAATKAAGGS